MQARRSYDHLSLVTQAGIQLTEHAAQRSCDRVISADALILAMDYGREVQIRGSTYFVVGRKEVESAARRGIAMHRLEGLQVVVASNGAIITVQWNHKLDNLRTDGRRYRSAA